MKKTTLLSKTMKKIRIDRDLSLRQMAIKYGLSYAYISAIENGKVNVPVDYFTKCCDILSLNQEEKIELFNAILELQRDYLADIVNDEQKTLLNMIYDLFKRLKNGINSTREEILNIVTQIKNMLDEITREITELNLFSNLAT